MVNRRRVFGLSVVAMAAVLSVGVFAQKKDDKKDDKKAAEAQARENQAARKAVDDVVAGQPAPNDFNVAWVREDFIKAAGSKTYVPFIVTLDPSKATPGSPISFYWRVVSKTAAAAPPAAPAAGKKDDKKDDKNDKKKADYPWEDIGPLTPTGNSTSLRVARSFTVSAGSYDVYVVAKEPASLQKGAPAPKMSVFKKTIDVPDYWNGELNTSSIIVAQRVDPLPAPLTPDQMIERPYALGGAEILPSMDHKIAKNGTFNVFLLIYNPKADASNKPNVTVEYSFCQASAGAEPKPGEPCKAGEKFFNRTNPVSFTAETLPPQFDVNAGQPLPASQGVSLQTFPEGDYRLEIKIIDKNANKTLMREVNFTVMPIAQSGSGAAR